MSLRAIDGLLAQQALIVGQVVDGLTGRAPRQTPTVCLFYQAAAGEPEHPYPLTARVQRNGLYDFAGDPGRAFPHLEGAETLDLRLRVRAVGYQERTIDLSLTAADLATSERTYQVGDTTVAVPVLVTPLVAHRIALQPEPVHLGGRVVRADDPDAPVENAQVRVTAPEARGPVSSDEDGFFTLEALPVALTVTVRVAREPEFDLLNETIALDYGQALNQRTFALSPT